MGKVWHGLTEVLGATKTTTEIAAFLLENKPVIAGIITTAVAALK